MAGLDLQKECPAICLLPHPTARSHAIAAKFISAGSILVSVPSLASVLVEREKGRRCDSCHRVQCVERSLRKCSGCASYWYCDIKCQETDWRAQHKRICKHYNKFIASSEYQLLPPHKKLDSILLSHLVARHMLSCDEITSLSMSIFQSLMPWPSGNVDCPPVCLGSTMSLDLLTSWYSRFGNNNFVIHSHLSTFGHGIFPLASRLFNHSCLPNAAPKYTLSGARPVVMEVVALRDILPDEEVKPCAASKPSSMLELSYGFRCHCVSCIFLHNYGSKVLGKHLTAFVGVQGRIGSELPSVSMQQLPPSLNGVLHEAYITSVAESFSSSSHGGDYTVALESGRILLALYLLIYPQNYPQIGLHLLELAKVQWNAVSVQMQPLAGDVRDFLALSRGVLMVFGPEGDMNDSPLSQLAQLEKLLDE
ncbi:hypothetical protein BDQ17DRAFT_1386869 [Cyathus striatus]|nr:hypothetical protein BDQ17DRAFT_1386869 [Cyathus striatus]